MALKLVLPLVVIRALAGACFYLIPNKLNFSSLLVLRYFIDRETSYFQSIVTHFMYIFFRMCYKMYTFAKNTFYSVCSGRCTNRVDWLQDVSRGRHRFVR